MFKQISLFLMCMAVLPANANDTGPLTEMQKYVTQHGGTEKPFENEYWNHHEEGIYVDIISGEPLFSSTDKYDSGTGWPSFTQPIENNFVKSEQDNSHGMKRTEVKSSSSGSHLGHVFDDGPTDKGGKRYCINSAALRFIPKMDLEEKGYGKYLALFGEKGSSSGAQPLTSNKPKLLAIYFYADWCGHCKVLTPRINQAIEKNKLDAEPVLFITFDLTDKGAINQSKLQAEQLGLGNFLKKQGSATGYMVLLDAATGKDLMHFDRENTAESIGRIILKHLRDK